MDNKLERLKKLLETAVKKDTVLLLDKDDCRAMLKYLEEYSKWKKQP